MMGTSVDALSATVKATTVEAAEVEDAGTDVTIIKSGATILGRTVGRLTSRGHLEGATS